MAREKMAKCFDRISYALSYRNIKQSELCRRTGIPKSAMSQYVSGAFEPKQDRVYLISKALNVSEAWLMGYSVPMEREEVQKKNDQLVELVTRLRKDDEFAEMVKMLNNLKPEQYPVVKPILSALAQK